MIELNGIRKQFRQNTGGAGLFKTLIGRVPGRQVTALDDLNFRVEEGQFYSLLGRNGAGKTTAIKILSTLLLPDSGTGTVAGFDIERQATDVRSVIGVSVRGERSVYWRQSGRQNLEYFGRLYDLSGRDLKRRVSEMAEVIGLSDRLDDYVERYSMGMKQRLAIGCALIHSPRVLLLDEPTIGLDAASARSLRRFITSDLREREKVSILYTTHYMHEAEEMSDVVGILHEGRIVAEGTPARVKGLVAGQATVELQVRGASADLASSIEQHDGVQAVSVTELDNDVTSMRIVGAGSEVPVPAITSLVFQDGAEIRALAASGPTLEDAFIALTESGLSSPE